MPLSTIDIIGLHAENNSTQKPKIIWEVGNSAKHIYLGFQVKTYSSNNIFDCTHQLDQAKSINSLIYSPIMLRLLQALHVQLQ